jgi:hypothetical protein
MDYLKIIERNWNFFSQKFDDREKLRSHFLALKNYRNPLGHIREMDPVEQRLGEAAVLWFRRTLEDSLGSPSESSNIIPPSA